MNEQIAQGQPAKVHQPSYSLPHSWKLGFGAAIVMVVLALIGVGLSTGSRASAPKYWMALVPVYGLLCIVVAWYRSREGECGPIVILRQVLHWLIIAIAVWLDFYMRGVGEESGIAAGLNALLLLSIGCFLAGVHFEWLFTLVGTLLIVTLIVVVKADQYLWLVVLAGVLIVVLMFGLMRWLHRRGPHPKAN
jgi:hypothetical protein